MTKVVMFGFSDKANNFSLLHTGPYHVQVIDFKEHDALESSDNIDVVNVFLEYSEKFVEIVSTFVRDIAPGVTIIHSEVPVGTIEALYEASEFPREFVYRNNRGHVGGETLEGLQRATSYLSGLGMAVKPFSGARLIEISTYLQNAKKSVLERFRADMEKQLEVEGIPTELMQEILGSDW